MQGKLSGYNQNKQNKTIVLSRTYLKILLYIIQKLYYSFIYALLTGNIHYTN